MPLLRRQPFHREKPPPDLRPDEEVFLCKLTNEIFRDYEKFFERIILCNSLVWSCAITGRAGLTYSEAEECEEKALKQLATFPDYLQRPILYLANQTQRTRLEFINDDVFVFAKDRFFIGEVVEVLLGKARQSCKVLAVIPPEGAVVNGDASDENGEEGEKKKSSSKAKAIKPEQYQYIVKDLSKDNTYTVKSKMVSRKKGLYTRDKSKLFLKQSCDSTDGIWRVKLWRALWSYNMLLEKVETFVQDNVKLKEAKLKKFGIGTMSFSDIFSGPPPVFTFSEIKKKPAKKPEPKPESRDNSPAPSKKKDQSKKPSPAPVVDPKLTPEELAFLKEQQRLEMLAEKQKERDMLRKKWEDEKERKKKEKALEIEKKREEKRIQAELFREWNMPRDDLDCDDLKVLPEPTPVSCKIPLEHFGDAVMVVEFVNCFSSLFELKESFPKGFTLEVLEEALNETDAGGLMADLLLMMLTAVFSLEEEEEQEELELAKESKDQATEGIEGRMEMKDMSVNQLIDAATMMSHVPLLTHGVTLRKLPLDNFTLTEILRLHLLSSGAEANPGNAKFRYQQRGGYMPTDDAGLEFRRQEQDIIMDLGVENIYDICPSDKLKILKVLVDQFLTYAATRDLIEDNGEKLRQLKMDLKQLQWKEQRREREEAAARYKRRMEERAKEKERIEKKRAKQLKQKEDEMKKAVAKALGKGDDSTTENMEVDKKAEESEDEDEPPISQEERERLQQEEDDAEADKKAEYMMKERDFLESINKLQHGTAIYPLGRDRMYRRYWMFQSVPGIYVEHDEGFVNEAALKPCSQNPNGSLFVNSVFVPPPKLSKREPSDIKPENKDGSDKENDSMNASGLNENIVNDVNNSSLNVSSADSSLIASAASSLANTPVLPAAVQRVKSGDDIITISDDDDSNDKPPKLEEEEIKEPPPAVETPATKQITERSKNQWAFFTTEDDIELLLNSLNNRGFRESALKSAIIENKNKLMEIVTEVPIEMLTIPKEEDVKDGAVMMSPKVRTKEWRQGKKSIKGQVKNDSAGEGLELNLREMLLDLEERIHVGGLGYIRVSDRAAWRDAIENGSYEPCTEDTMFAKDTSDISIDFEDKDDKDESTVQKDAEVTDEKDSEVTDEKETSNESGEENKEKSDGETTKDADISKDVPSAPMAVARDLAKALVQIEKGIEHRFLVPPFGEDEKVKQARIKAQQEALKKEEQKKSKKKAKDNEDDSSEDDEPEITKVTQTHKTTLERWEESCMFSTSLSQVFLHLSTLEKAVTWSKSVLHTRCKLCRRKGDPEKMLLCDQCDRGHHMYCLKPALKNVPKGDWFCPDCKPKETKKRSPRKERRPTFSERQSSDEEEDDDEEEEDSDDEAEDEASSEEENDETCAVCGVGGTLICCDNCPLSYHLACAQPPLKKVPKRKWLCQICSGEDSKAGKIKFLAAPKSKKGQKSANSSRQSSKKGSPRDTPRNSPLTIKPPKKRKRLESSDDDKPKLKRNAKSTSKLVPDTKSVFTDETKHYTSSSRGNTTVQQLKIIEEIVLSLMAEDDAWPFLKPVLKRDAPDYHELIKKPMDFSTIRNKINKFIYVDPAEIVQDVRQIFTNCIEYNKRTTQEFKAGASMSKLFEKKLKDMESEVVSNGPASKRARTK